MQEKQDEAYNKPCNHVPFIQAVLHNSLQSDRGHFYSEILSRVLLLGPCTLIPLEVDGEGNAH